MMKLSSQAVKCVALVVLSHINQCFFIGQSKPNKKFEFWNCLMLLSLSQITTIITKTN